MPNNKIDIARKMEAADFEPFFPFNFISNGNNEYKKNIKKKFTGHR